VPTNTNQRETGTLFQRQTETSSRSPTCQVHSEAGEVEALRPDFAPFNEDLRFSQEDGDDDKYSKRPPLQPWVITSPPSAQNACPRLITSPRRFTDSETVYDAVRRVVQALSEVFADRELEHFLDNLNDTELDELLVDPGKLKEVCDTALVKYTGKVFRLGESFGPRPARLIEIVS
jgi:hypothetical protein